MKRAILAVAATICAASALADGVASFVDPFWGCGATQSPPSEGMARGWNWEKAQTGNTHPGATTPFGWVSVCAYTGGYPTGYGRYFVSSGGTPRAVYPGQRSYGFTHFHQSGTGWIGKFYNYFLFVPHSDGAALGKASRLVDEAASPGWYSATLADYGASFELAAAPFAACHRYRFGNGGGRLRIDTTKGGLSDEYLRRPNYKGTDFPTQYEVRQTDGGKWQGRIRARGRDIFFAVLTDAVKLRSSSCKNGVVEILFAESVAETAIGFSLADEAEAVRRAGEAASAGFDALRHTASESWNHALGRVRVRFSDHRLVSRFYSALYHSMVKPVNCGNGWLDFATFWDMYKTQLPLALSVAPDAGRGITEHLLSTIERHGFAPVWQLMDDKMSPRDGQATALPVYTLADAFFRGILNKSDYSRLKEAMRRELENGTDISKMSPTHALDLAGAYGAVAFVAEACGDAKHAEEMRKLSAVWKSVYDQETGLLVEKKWYYEGNHWNYSFRPHPGMNERVALAGGAEGFARLLDRFFCVGRDFPEWSPQKDRIRRMGAFEGLNNECDMEAPFAYLWCGRPDRMAEVVDLVRLCRFADGEGGLPGNNDSGGTSAWYVWSCLGIHPLPGTPYYLLGSPAIESAEIDFADGTLKIVVERESAKSIYPAGFRFNGRDFREAWLPVRELEKDGKLVFRLKDKPPSASFPVPNWLD